MNGPHCPDCENEMVASDSGEPDCIAGWRCTECNQFFTDGEANSIMADFYIQKLNDQPYEEYFDDEDIPF